MDTAAIQAIRKSLSLTQAQFSSLLGVHAITVCRWETGALRPTPYQLGLIQHFGKAAPRCQAAAVDLGTMLVTHGVIGVLSLLFAFARAEPPRPARRRSARVAS